MGSIKIQRGVTVLPAGSTSVDVPYSLLGGAAALAAGHAFVKLSSAGPIHISAPTTLTAFGENVNEYTARVSLVDATTLRVDQAVATVFSKFISWQIWEYVGPSGGPDEFLVRGTSPPVACTSAIANDILNPFPVGVARDVFIFSRGGLWSGSGQGATNIMSLMNCVGLMLTSFGTDFLRYFIGVNAANDIWNAEYSAVEFVGSNWTAAFTSGNGSTALLFGLFSGGGDINNWSNAFIHAQRRSGGVNGSAVNQQGLTVFPAVATTAVLIQYPLFTQSGTLNSFYVMALSNPFITVEHQDTINGGAPQHPQVTASTQTIDVPTAGISGALDEATVIASSGTTLVPPFTAIIGAPLGMFNLELLNSTTIRWYTSDGTLVNDWSQDVIDFSGLLTSEPAIFEVAQAENQAAVAQAANQALVVQAANSQEVAISSSQSSVTQATNQLPVIQASSIIEVTVVTAGEANLALFNLCPVADDLCVSLLNTRPFGWQLLDSAGVPVDITGGTFLFTVNRQEDPTDETDQIVEIAGTILVAASGTFEFQPSQPPVSPTRFNEVGNFFYDVEYTDLALSVYTLLKGKIEIKQTITDPAVLV